MNLEAVQAQSRHAKLAHGLTDNGENDPYGDSDQTPISASEPDTQHFLRQLWCDGGDLAEYIDMGGLSPFVQAVMECNVVTVRQMLQRGNVQDLLERRYCSLRLSALLVLVAWCKNQPALTIPMVSETASILLRYGARPDVKDYTGKTIVHYGLGARATPTTMVVADMCIRAQPSAYLLGRKVRLQGLSNQAMNGQVGVAGGFCVESNRRQVTIETKTVAIKPENLVVIDDDGNPVPMPPLTKLVDVQDRNGAVALHELVLSFSGEEVATVLIDQYEASIDVTDVNGISPSSIALRNGIGSFSKASRVINKATMSQRRTCLVCRKKTTANNKPLLRCSTCRNARYCSAACQRQDWKRHKSECKKVTVETVVISPNDIPVEGLGVVNWSSGKSKTAENALSRPQGVQIDEEFYIKVQAIDMVQPVLIYDKTRQCQFSLPNSAPAFRALVDRVKSEKATHGVKVYLKARMNASGCMHIQTAESGLKKW